MIKRTPPVTENPPVPLATSSIVTALAAQLHAANTAERVALVQQFWHTAAARTPMIEDDGDTVTFVWRDATAHEVLIAVNRITTTTASASMERVAGTDIWHRSFRVGRDWRGSYAFVAVTAEAAAALGPLDDRWRMRYVRENGVSDPRNDNQTHTHGGQSISVAAMPDAPPQEWLTPTQPVARGTAHAHTLPDGRQVHVHAPAEVTRDHPVVIMCDGQAWDLSGYAAGQVDALVAARQIRAPFLVMIDQSDLPTRVRELSIDGPIAPWIANTLVPWLRTTFPVSMRTADVIVSGESLGGLTALRTLLEFGHVVGGAISQSASLWQCDLLDAARAAQHGRAFIAVGTHEQTLLIPNQQLAATLGARIPVTYREINGGHDFAWWRSEWATGVRELLGTGLPAEL